MFYLFVEINQLSLFHPGEFDLNETFFLSPDLIFTLHPQYCSPFLEIEIERLTNQNGFCKYFDQTLLDNVVFFFVCKPKKLFPLLRNWFCVLFQ